MNRWLVGAIAAIAVAFPVRGADEPQKPKREAEKLPVIRSVLSLDKTVRGALLLHFTAEEWKAATKDAVPIKEFAKNQLVLEAVPMPGGRGGMLIGVRCPPGCTPLMTVKAPLGPPRKPGVELTPHPDTIFIPECDCSGVEPEVPKLPGKSPSRGSCRLVIRLVSIDQPIARQRLAPIFTCENIDCTRRCRFGIVRLANGVNQIGCLCE